ncbi:MAG: hypothetical protein LBL41_00130 [Bifidobacteriaceae bacterium]|jgi:hypothetical protein|nr:hypothetical protein [Bifidobacteriaceae bacterium]
MVRKNKWTREHSEINMRAAAGYERIETKRGKDYKVTKTLEGSSVYLCPGCNQAIDQGKPSFTVIELNHMFGEQAAIDERRHWHVTCWRRLR